MRAANLRYDNLRVRQFRTVRRRRRRPHADAKQRQPRILSTPVRISFRRNRSAIRWRIAQRIAEENRKKKIWEVAVSLPSLMGNGEVWCALRV